MPRVKTKRTLKMIIVPMLMVVCGFAAYVSAAIFWMNLGSKFHDNYEYYGSYPGLFFMIGSSVIGFLVPAVVVWYLGKRS